VKYINQQQEHHRHRSFRDEYLELLRKFEVDFKEQFVFEEPG
jgi:putative transposase